MMPLVLQEPPRLIDLRFDIVVAGLRAHTNLFQSLLMGLSLVALARLLIAKFAVIQDFTDRRPFQRGDFH